MATIEMHDASLALFRAVVSQGEWEVGLER